MLKGILISLRPMVLEDIDLICEWFIENELSVYYIGTVLSSIEKVKEYFENCLKNSSNRRDFMIIKKETGESLGMASLENINWQHRSASFVVFLGKHGERKKEYIWDAHIRCFDFAFDVLNLHRIEMKMYTANKPIIKLLEEWKHGIDDNDKVYKFEGKLKDAAFFLGEYCDAIIYGIIRDNYKQIRKNFNKVFKSLKD